MGFVVSPDSYAFEGSMLSKGFVKKFLKPLGDHVDFFQQWH